MFLSKQKIARSELRIGIVHDVQHAPGTFWYHPECLWKTFDYRKHANERISCVDQVSAPYGRCISDEIREQLQALIDQSAKPQVGSKRKSDAGNQSPGQSPAKKIPAARPCCQSSPSLCIEDETVLVHDSFEIKDKLALGFRFSFDEKAWESKLQENAAIQPCHDCDVMRAMLQFHRPLGLRNSDNHSGRVCRMCSSCHHSRQPPAALLSKSCWRCLRLRRWSPHRRQQPTAI